MNAHTGGATGAPGTGGYKVLFVTGALFFVAGAVVLRRLRLTHIPDTDEEVPASTRLAIT